MTLDTTTELLARLKQELRDESSTTSTETRLLARLNEAYFDIVSGGANLNDSHRGLQSGKPFIFSWAMSQTNIVFNTEAPITNLTATVAQNATALTLSATYATSLTGYFLKIGSDQEIYRISAHTAGTDAITLDKDYIESSVTAGACEIFKLDYTIGTDVLMPTNALLCYFKSEPLPIYDKREFESYGVLRNVKKGLPTSVCVINNDRQNKTLTLRFDNYTENAERFELPYVAFPTSLDTSSVNPILPPHHNQILIDYAAAIEYDLRDDTVSDRYFKRALDRFKVLKAEDRQFTVYNDGLFAKIVGWSGSFRTLRGGSTTGGHPRNQKNYQN